MIKKFKDLSDRDVKSICLKHSTCYECPLGITFDYGKHIFCVHDILERKIEIIYEKDIQKKI